MIDASQVHQHHQYYHITSVKASTTSKPVLFSIPASKFTTLSTENFPAIVVVASNDDIEPTAKPITVQQKTTNKSWDADNIKQFQFSFSNSNRVRNENDEDKKEKELWYIVYTACIIFTTRELKLRYIRFCKNFDPY